MLVAQETFDNGSLIGEKMFYPVSSFSSIEGFVTELCCCYLKTTVYIKNSSVLGGVCMATCNSIYLQYVVVLFGDF